LEIQASIRGIVRDAQDRETLPGAYVILIGSGLGTATDDEGRYIIPNVKPGTYIIRAGYLCPVHREKTGQ